MVFVGTIDGRLVALDARTGALVWQVVTVDQSLPYSITGAPRVVKGRVIIGNGGADYGVRGYVSAYDTESGKLDWRFHTVPGNPANGFESSSMERAAGTWTGEWWKNGGGGTVWDSIAYDEPLDLLYVGTGNGSPWNRRVRSPGGGDNLYLSSILALRPETGELVWHYQTTPGESWDYTATQHMILADLEIAGQRRKVLLQAPKNGFFYVLDRATGALISAKPFADVTWATRIDPISRRPEESNFARFEQPALIKPGPIGAHNWQPMSFNPQTGLVYFPVQNTEYGYAHDSNFRFKSDSLNTGLDSVAGSKLPRPNLVRPTGALVAWDPISQTERWRVRHASAINGGTLSTAGELVFQGTADGRFVAYHAGTGVALWEFPVRSPVFAPPITYQIDGVQRIAVMATADRTLNANIADPPRGRLLVFALADR